MAKRETINFDDSVISKLKILHAKNVKNSEQFIPFSKTVNDLLRTELD